MDKTTQLLDSYRRYESLLREHGTDYKTVEDAADDQLQNQLRITRQMRNFLSHNPDASFLTISDKQLHLLQQLVQEEAQKGEILKRYVKTPKTAAAKEGELVIDVLLRMSRQKQTQMLVYTDATILGTISIYALGKLLHKANDARLNRKTYGKWGTNYRCLIPETPMEQVQALSLQDLMICCTADGTSTGKFLGVYPAS